MTNPYAGAIGYNNALDDACRAVSEVIDREGAGDNRIMNLGVDILMTIVRLRRRQHHRRRKWVAPAITEVEGGEDSQ